MNIQSVASIQFESLFSIGQYVVLNYFSFVVRFLVASPLSDMNDHRIVLGYTNTKLVVFQIGCTIAQNIASLIGFRSSAGMRGSSCSSLGVDMIADLFSIEELGMATAISIQGPLMGPNVGPSTRGLIGASHIAWRGVA